MGERIHLEHVRVGGKLYTTPRWIEEFGSRLAEADAAYFKTASEPPRRKPVPAPVASFRARRRSPRRSTDQQEAERRARIAAELDAEGL